MPKLLDRIRHWWHAPKQAAAPVVPFAIPCTCGHTVSGRRRGEFQVVRCLACNAEIFVLPQSPLPTVASGAESKTIAAYSRPRWILPVAVICSLAVVGIACWVVISSFPSGAAKNGGVALTPEQAKARALAHQQKAAEHISLGHFALALEQLDALDTLQRQTQQTWVEPHWLTHERREIALYTDLMHQSLEELLVEAIDLPELEWQQQFQKRYQGKAVILDMEVTRLPDGRIEHGYQLHAAGQHGRFDLAALPFFATLPAGKLRRVLFGARLKSIHRAAPGVWTIQFSPDSVVLLTDAQALVSSSPDLDDAATRALLKQQGNK